MTVTVEHIPSRLTCRICWFLTDDMRVRVGSAQVMGGVNLISYSTEIRCHGADDFEAVRAKAEALLASLP